MNHCTGYRCNRKLMEGQILCPSCWEQVPPEMVKELKPLKKDRSSPAYKAVVAKIQNHVRSEQLDKDELDQYVENYR